MELIGTIDFEDRIIQSFLDCLSLKIVETIAATGKDTAFV